MAGIDLTNRKSFEELEKLPRPSNENLIKLFIGIDTIVIKDKGVSNGRALSNNVLLTISNKDNIKKFANLFKINEANTGFYCMCLGTYAIELLSNSKIKSTIGFHHEYSIRFDEWNGDAELVEIENFLEFLSELGFDKPFKDQLETKRNMEADRVAERKWLEIAPKCFSKYWVEIKSLEYNIISKLLKELNLEIPDKQKQIVTLLQTFGRTENFWTGYPSYEELPNDILKTFDLIEIINAYLNSDRNYKTRKGLGRFLCSYDFKKIRKKFLKYITDEVIADLEKCFDNIGEKRGINEIFGLKNEKKNNS